MIKFTRSTKKKIDKVRSGSSAASAPGDNNNTNGSSPSRSSRRNNSSSSKSRSQPNNNAAADQSVASAYSARSDYTSETGYSSTNNNNYATHHNNNGGNKTTASSTGGGRSIASSTTNNSRRFSSAASVASISSASVFSPSVTPSVKMSLLPPNTANITGGASTTSEQTSTAIGNHHGLQPSSARLLRDLNNSARSSLLSSLGTAASRTFRSYKMTLPRCPPPVKTWDGSSTSMGGSGANNASSSNNTSGAYNGAGSTPTNHTADNEDELTLESDLELLGRTVHAVSSALTEPPKENDRFAIYDVSFNPKGCVWDALIVVQLQTDEGEGEGDDGSSRSRSSARSAASSTSQQQNSKRRNRSTSRNRRGGGGKGSSSRSSSRSVSRRRLHRSSSRSKYSNSSAGGGGGGAGRGDDNKNTFSFPIRVTCAEDDIGTSSTDSIQQQINHRRGQGPHPKRAKTYAVDLAVIDDMPHHPISSWSASEAAGYRDDMKSAMEWVSYGVRRSMARSMFPQFPEGCQGRPFREVYQLNKKLKSGTFSTVCRGVHRATGKQVAVKCILRKKIEPSVDAAVFEEVLIMSGLHHRYICPMIDYFEEDRCHFVVMELEKGGDLCERLNDKVTYSEPDARTVVRNICEAMEFVHNKGFAHCDIKPRNYLLRSKRDDVDVRLADFGFAQHVHAPNSLTSQCGTPFFVAPEVINRKPYDQKVDMWSIGVTTYLLLSGETPFNGKNRQQLFRRISCDEPTFSDDKWGNVSDVAIDFVLRLLTKDPAKRMSASEALRHEWLVGLERSKTPMNASASMAASEDFSVGTEHSRKSKDPPPQSSPGRKSSRSSRPPPPPKPSSRRGESDRTGSNDTDENARLLDVIKEQDAKIEKLEAMVKRMLEPEGAVHEC